MADKNEGLRSDEMKELLKDISESESPKALDENEDIKIYEPKKDTEAEDEFSFVTDLSSGKSEAVSDEGSHGGSENYIPETIFNHLSNEGECADAGKMCAHFTESDGSEPPCPEENPENDDVFEEDNHRKLKKACRVLQKLSIIPKAVIYIIAVALVSAYLSYFIISVGNDVFALVTDKGTVVVEIPEDATDEQVAQILEESGVIEYGWVYKLYMKYRGSGDEGAVYISGSRTLKYEYNYSQIITALTTKSYERDIIRLTVPEGYTADQIIELFVSNGIGTKEGFIDAINNYPFKHEFVKALDEAGYPETRKYRLEGYLYPDTYDFYTDSSEVAVINKMLNAFNEKFYRTYIRQNSDGTTYKDMMLTEYGLTLDDLVTLASMVQSEGGNAADFECISYVFHNRLSHKASFPKLESDATIQYILPERENDSTQLNISIDSPYNTYLYDGLPPGAISNPGTDALSAAMFPSAPLNSKGKEINAYFFVSNNAGKTYYASTASGHESNVVQVRKDNQAIEEGTYEG